MSAFRSLRSLPARLLARAPTGALLLALPLALSAQAPLAIDRDASRIGFVSKQMGVSVEGHFSDWEAEIVLDEDDPGASSAHIVVQTASIHTGHRDTDAEVKRGSWLAVSQFPTAEFVSDSVERLADGRYRASGELRIRDQVETVSVPFTVSADDDGRRRIRGDFVIQRARFNVGGGAWGDFDVVANDVRIRFELQTGSAGP